MDARRAQAHPITRQLQQMYARVANVQPATDAEQRSSYQKMVEKIPV